MPRGRTERSLARRLGPGSRGGAGRAPEDLLVEEPLEIRLGDTTVATTMRTPGHDYELAVGFLWAEGLLDGPPAEVRYCATGPASESGFNVVTVRAAGSATGSAADGATAGTTGTVVTPRLGLTSSSCGVCGAEQVEALVERLDPLPSAGPLPWAVLSDAGARVHGLQELFAATGGSHAAAVIDPSAPVDPSASVDMSTSSDPSASVDMSASSDPSASVDPSVPVPAGREGLVREDIGRHNAVDKLVGRLVLDGALPDPSSPTGRRVLWVSGRASFEIVQKAWAGGFSALVAVGAASALAARTAAAAGMVLAGFGRDGHVTLYAGDDLVELPGTGDAGVPGSGTAAVGESGR